MNEFYRKPWNKEKVELLIKLWPQLGTNRTSKELGLTKQQIKSKVDKLKLIQIPKNERKCFNCNTGFQTKRAYGNRCKSCYLKHRNEKRKNQPKPKKQWIGDLLRTLRYRSKENCNLSVDYLLKLWDKQAGRCFYSDIELLEPVFYGRGRNYSVASIDRIDSTRGYVTGNVVWCCWGCNSAKLDFSVKDYVQLCEKIIFNKQNIFNKIQLLSEELPSKYSIIINP